MKAYRVEVQNLVCWWSENNLSLNTAKTEELIINFGRSQDDKCAPVFRVSSFRFLGPEDPQQQLIGKLFSGLSSAQRRSLGYSSKPWRTSTAHVASGKLPAFVRTPHTHVIVCSNSFNLADVIWPSTPTPPDWEIAFPPRVITALNQSTKYPSLICLTAPIIVWHNWLHIHTHTALCCHVSYTLHRGPLSSIL